MTAVADPGPLVLALVGPTAVGKTALAIRVARELPGEIIGLDSRQIYRGMAVGTAQPTPAELALVRHHLVGVRSPEEKITAGEYVRLVIAAMQDIRRRGRTPLVCGGAGLYYRALAEGLFPGSRSDPATRAWLETEYDTFGPEVLYQRLQKIDPEYARIVHPNNRKRLVRALEIYELTGKPPSRHFQEQKLRSGKQPELFTVLVTAPLEILEQRIAARTGSLLERGWIEEVRTLLEERRGGAYHPMDSIGYQQIMSYLEGRLDYAGMIAEINLRTRQYARKQITWFRGEQVAMTVESRGGEWPDKTVRQILRRFLKTRSRLKPPAGSREAP